MGGFPPMGGFPAINLPSALPVAVPHAQPPRQLRVVFQSSAPSRGAQAHAQRANVNVVKRACVFTHSASTQEPTPGARTQSPDAHSQKHFHDTLVPLCLERPALCVRVRTADGRRHGVWQLALLDAVPAS